MKRTKKKVTVGTAVLFIVVYITLGGGLNLLVNCLLRGNPLDSTALLNALASGLGLMTARQLVWGFEYLVHGHII